MDTREQEAYNEAMRRLKEISDTLGVGLFADAKSHLRAVNRIRVLMGLQDEFENLKKLLVRGEDGLLDALNSEKEETRRLRQMVQDSQEGGIERAFSDYFKAHPEDKGNRAAELEIAVQVIVNRFKVGMTVVESAGILEGAAFEIRAQAREAQKAHGNN